MKYKILLERITYLFFLPDKQFNKASAFTILNLFILRFVSDKAASKKNNHFAKFPVTL